MPLVVLARPCASAVHSLTKCFSPGALAGGATAYRAGIPRASSPGDLADGPKAYRGGNSCASSPGDLAGGAPAYHGGNSRVSSPGDLAGVAPAYRGGNSRFPVLVTRLVVPQPITVASIYITRLGFYLPFHLVRCVSLHCSSSFASDVRYRKKGVSPGDNLPALSGGVVLVPINQGAWWNGL